MFMMVFFWIGLILLAVLVVKVLFDNGALKSGRGDDAPSPRDILSRRYARGEISKEEFDRMRADLS